MRHLTYDLELDNPHSPVAGDIAVSSRTTYRIIHARPVESRVWDNRWMLTVERIGDQTVADTVWLGPDNRRWGFGSYAKGETPAKFFAGRSYRDRDEAEAR